MGKDDTGVSMLRLTHLAELYCSVGHCPQSGFSKGPCTDAYHQQTSLDHKHITNERKFIT